MLFPSKDLEVSGRTKNSRTAEWLKEKTLYFQQQFIPMNE